MRLLTAGILVLCLVASSVEAQRVRRVTDFRGIGVGEPIVDDTGRFLLASWNGDPDGSNPSKLARMMLWDFQLDELRPLDPSVGILDPALSDFTDDGQWIVFASTLDPLGANADGSWELFRIATEGSAIEQVTDFPAPFGTIDLLDASDSGSRIAFGGAIDPIGANPTLAGQVYVVNPDGSVLLQSTTALSGTLLALSIDDAGERIVFSHDGDFGAGTTGVPRSYRTLWNRAEFLQLSAVFDVSAISGDGQTVLYRGPAVSDWDATSVDVLAIGPDVPVAITDDGLWVTYLGVPVGDRLEVVRRRSDGGGSPLLLTQSGRFTELAGLAASGDGSLVGLSIRHGSLVGVDNADGSSELVTVDAATALATALTDNPPFSQPWEPDISADGRRAVISGFTQDNLFLVEPDGFGVRQLAAGFFLESPTLSADGGLAVLRTFADLDEPPECSSGGDHLFGIDADGNASQLTPQLDCLSSYGYPDVTDDGLRVVYQAGAGQLETVTVAGGPAVPLTNDGDNLRKWPRVSGDGSQAVFVSGATSPRQIFRVPTDGSFAEVPIGSDPAYSTTYPSISFDGTRVVYQSEGDPLGTNADHNSEIFLRDLQADTVLQLTDTTAGDNLQALISGDGEWVWFGSSSDFFGDSGGLTSLYRLEVATGAIERALGSAPAMSIVNSSRYRAPFSVSADGQRAAVATSSDPTGSPDGPFGSELYFVEFDLAGSGLVVGGATATTLIWQADPRYLTYDAIRGDLAALALAAAPVRVELGTVLCLEEDSTDVSTVGFEDSTTPLPGAGFFYLYRGRPGPAAASTSWGEASDGSPRLPSAGSCAD